MENNGYSSRSHAERGNENNGSMKIIKIAKIIIK